MHDTLITFLKRNGSKRFKIISGNVMCTCPLHNESRPSFGVQIDKQGKGVFNCYGCGSKGSIWDLIRELEPYRTNRDIKDLIDDFSGESPVHKLKDSDVPTLFKISDEDYARFAIRHEYWSMRGVDDNSVKRFKLGYCPERWSVTIPVRAFDTHDIIGVCFRVIDSHPVFPHELKLKLNAGMLGKYTYLQNTKPSYSLFGVEQIKNRNEVYLFEGPIDAINFMQRNPDKQALAKFGTMLTKAQLNYLQRFQKVIVVSDLDENGQGQKNSMNVTNLLREKGIITSVMRTIGDAKDYTEACLKGLNINLMQLN